MTLIGAVNFVVNQIQVPSKMLVIERVCAEIEHLLALHSIELLANDGDKNASS